MLPEIARLRAPHGRHPDRMRIALLATVIFVGMTAIGALAAPAISVDESEVDFGIAAEGTFVTHRFVLMNIGDATLEISDVLTTCGCSTATLSTRTLQPGESVELEAILDTSGEGGRTVMKTFYVISNDPTDARLTLWLRGKVKKLGLHQIGPSDLEFLLKALIDLRSPEEFASAHIWGAVNIPYDEFDRWLHRLPEGLAFVVYDSDGTTSDEIAERMIQSGWPEARSLFGGFIQWVETIGSELIWPLQE